MVRRTGHGSKVGDMSHQAIRPMGLASAVTCMWLCSLQLCAMEYSAQGLRHCYRLRSEASRTLERGVEGFGERRQDLGARERGVESRASDRVLTSAAPEAPSSPSLPRPPIDRQGDS